MSSNFDPDGPVPAVLTDISDSGEITVQRGQKKKIYYGRVFLLVPKKSKSGNKFRRELIHEAKKTFVERFSFRCTSLDGKKMYRLIGDRVDGRSVTVDRPATSVCEKQAARATNIQAKTPISPADHACTPTKADTKKAAEYAALAAQRAAGLDPQVRMNFITKYLSESRSNLYRKMGKEFPMPVKRGRSAFWSLSVIEQYKTANTIEGVNHG